MKEQQCRGQKKPKLPKLEDTIHRFGDFDDALEFLRQNPYTGYASRGYKNKKKGSAVVLPFLFYDDAVDKYMIPTLKSVDKKGKRKNMDINITVEDQPTNLSILIGEMTNQDARRMVYNSRKWGLTQPEMQEAIQAMRYKPVYKEVGLVANDYVRESEIEVGSAPRRWLPTRPTTVACRATRRPSVCSRLPMVPWAEGWAGELACWSCSG